MRIGKIQIDVKASRWPWQAGYNWRGMTNSRAPLNAGGARFGGGWRYKLGFAVCGQTLMIDLLFGMITIRVFDWAAAETAAAERKAKIDRMLAEMDTRREERERSRAAAEAEGIPF